MSDVTSVPAKTETADSSPTTAPPPSVADLQAEIATAREELVASIAELKAETAPAALARRGGRTVQGFFTDEYGGIRPDRVAIVGAVVVGLVVLRIIRRRRA